MSAATASATARVDGRRRLLKRLVYRALVPFPDGRLRLLVFGWTLGYLLEVLAFIATAEVGVRSLFLVYPIAVGVPAALVVRKRMRARSASDAAPVTGSRISSA